MTAAAPPLKKSQKFQRCQTREDPQVVLLADSPNIADGAAAITDPPSWICLIFEWLTIFLNVLLIVVEL